MAGVIAARRAAEALIHDPAALRTMRHRRIGAPVIQILTCDAWLALGMIQYATLLDDVGERYQLTSSPSIVKIIS
jgi:hypothetical protein